MNIKTVGGKISMSAQITSILIHDIRGDYPELRPHQKFEAYAFRGFLLGAEPGTLVFLPGPLSGEVMHYLSDLNEQGIGAPYYYVLDMSKRTNPEWTLYDAICEDGKACRIIRDVVERGGKIHVFKSSNAAMVFAKRLGLEWSAAFDWPTPEVVEPWNAKDFLREQARMHCFGDLLPRNAICKTRQEFLDVVNRFSYDGDFIIKLRPHSASTDGMFAFKKGMLPPTSVYEMFVEDSGVIVEEFRSHIPGSLTYRVMPSGEVSFTYASLQFLEDIPIGEPVTIEHFSDRSNGSSVGDHRGNITGPLGADLGPISWERIEKIADRVGKFIAECVIPTGYTGYINFDLIFDADHARAQDFVVEINARDSHSRNCIAVGDAISSRNGHQPLFVCGGNYFPGEHVRSYDGATQLLARAGLAYVAGVVSGVVLYHVPLLREHRQLGGFAAGYSFEIAVGTFLKGDTVLGP